MAPAHLRDHAKAARMIASFRDLQVGAVGRGQPESRRIVIRNVSRLVRDEGMPAIVLDAQDPLNDSAHFAYLVQPNEGIDFGKRLPQLAREPLRHATAYDQFLPGP